jgi:hypothetical protein
VSDITIQWPDEATFNRWIYAEFPEHFPVEITRDCGVVRRTQDRIYIDGVLVLPKELEVTFLVQENGEVHPHPSIFDTATSFTLTGARPRFDPGTMETVRAEFQVVQHRKEIQSIIDANPDVLVALCEDLSSEIWGHGAVGPLRSAGSGEFATYAPHYESVAKIMKRLFDVDVQVHWHPNHREHPS